MVTFVQVLVLVHLIGFALLLGGLVVQTRDRHPEVNATVLYGAWLELLTGGGLVTLRFLNHQAPLDTQLTVKLVLTLLVVVLVSKNRKFASIPKGLWTILVAMTLINAGIAVLWQ